MKAILDRVRSKRWLRNSLIGAAAFLVVFTVAGFFVAPPVLRNVLVKKLSETLHRTVAIREIAVNPFALSASVRGFVINDRNAPDPFLSFDELYVNLEAVSLFRGGPIFKDKTFFMFTFEEFREGMPRPARREFERMYSIQIKASRGAIANEIGRFGEPDRKYFTPRFVTVHRAGGQPNQTGCIIQYRVMVASLCFNLLLEKVIDQHYFIYRVRDGFAREGVLIFEIEENRKGIGILSIYVAFDFYRGLAGWTRPLWAMLKVFFPAYIHDVIWNHSMCQIKDIVEGNGERDYG